MKISTIIRTLVLAVALINQVLASKGISPLPIDDAQIESVVSIVFTIVASIWSWWKNNDITKKAIGNTKRLEKLNK